jgi:two-component system chemotaxis response regulator CheB
MNTPLRAVIADDSALYRAVLARVLSGLPGVEIVAQATNGAQAVELVKKLSPDVLTLDLNMPVLDGLGTLRALREAKLSCEVIVVSSETRQGASTTIDALQLGAVDFITKPAEDNAEVSSEVLSSELRRQLAAVRLRSECRRRIDAARGLPTNLAGAATPNAVIAPPEVTTSLLPEVIAIGTSTGGPSALPVLLGALPANFGVPILIVQHMPPLFTASLAESLARKCLLRVLEGHNGQLVLPAHVYIAPGGRHMKVKRAFDKSVRLLITDEPPENHCRPSVDTLFRSVAEEYGGRVLAAILTGMGNDGVAGLRVLKGLGATIIAQDEATSTVFGMPQEAIRAAVVDSVLPLHRIASALVDSLHPHGK